MATNRYHESTHDPRAFLPHPGNSLALTSAWRKTVLSGMSPQQRLDFFCDINNRLGGIMTPTSNARPPQPEQHVTGH